MGKDRKRLERLRAAEHILQWCENGGYLNGHGEFVDIDEQLTKAIEETVTYTPEEVAQLVENPEVESKEELVVEVTEETTQEAAHRLSAENAVLLNFASAKNPGGGFIRGSVAQEEDLCCCSGLYICLDGQTAYYETNRELRGSIYTDYLIYSPKVPFFRRHVREMLREPFFVSVITSPAPNAGAALEKDPECGDEIEAALLRRAGHIIAVAAKHGHRTLVLGAWGCGVFQNNPVAVSDAFDYWLKHDKFKTAFDKVVFAIWDNTDDKKVLKAFQKKFVGA